MPGTSMEGEWTSLIVFLTGKNSEKEMHESFLCYPSLCARSRCDTDSSETPVSVAMSP